MALANPTARPRFPSGCALGRAAGELAPGVGLCVAVAVGALALQAAERRVFGHVWLEALVLAIVLGTALRAAWTPASSWCSGVAFSAKTLLEIAVVLLGASVSATAVLAVGPPLLLGIAGVVVLALVVSYGLGRGLGLGRRMATLVACGNSICGNSAIAAVAPVIGADGDEIAASIGFTAVLGVVVVLGLPLLGAALRLSGLQFGALAGLTVYAVPQVLAATAPMGAVAIQVGTLVKLVRVMMLGPVCFGLSLLTSRRRTASKTLVEAAAEPHASAASRARFAPWFIVGFLVLMTMRSLGWIPPRIMPVLNGATTWLTIVSMAALGLGTDVRIVARSGLKVVAAVVLSLLGLVAASFGLIILLRLG